MEGRIYEGVEEKMESAEAYLCELGTGPERVRSLTAWSWIERTMRDLPTHYATSSHCIAISTGTFHACALRKDQTPVCWGTPLVASWIQSRTVAAEVPTLQRLFPA